MNFRYHKNKYTKTFILIKEFLLFVRKLLILIIIMNCMIGLNLLRKMLSKTLIKFIKSMSVMLLDEWQSNIISVN